MLSVPPAWGHPLVRLKSQPGNPPRTNTTRHPKEGLHTRYHRAGAGSFLAQRRTHTHTSMQQQRRGPIVPRTRRPHQRSRTPKGLNPAPPSGAWPRPSGKLIVLLLVAGDADILTCFTASGHTTRMHIAPRRPTGVRSRVVLGVPQIFTGQLGLLAAGAEPLQLPYRSC